MQSQHTGLFGDTMNTASRMETTCPVGCIQVSEATYELLQAAGAASGLVSTGGVDVKGKGRMVRAVIQRWELCYCGLCVGPSARLLSAIRSADDIHTESKGGEQGASWFQWPAACGKLSRLAACTNAPSILRPSAAAE
jgi:hypothetical protein